MLIILIVVLLVLFLGGGGAYYGRRAGREVPITAVDFSDSSCWCC